MRKIKIIVNICIAIMLCLAFAVNLRFLTVRQHWYELERNNYSQYLKILNTKYPGSFIIGKPGICEFERFLGPTHKPLLKFSGIFSGWSTFTPLFYKQINKIGSPTGAEVFDKILDRSDVYFFYTKQGMKHVLNYLHKEKFGLYKNYYVHPVEIFDESKKICLYQFNKNPPVDEMHSKINRLRETKQLKQWIKHSENPSVILDSFPEILKPSKLDWRYNKIFAATGKNTITLEVKLDFTIENPFDMCALKISEYEGNSLLRTFRCKIPVQAGRNIFIRKIKTIDNATRYRVTMRILNSARNKIKINAFKAYAAKSVKTYNLKGKDGYNFIGIVHTGNHPLLVSNIERIKISKFKRLRTNLHIKTNPGEIDKNAEVELLLDNNVVWNGPLSQLQKAVALNISLNPYKIKSIDNMKIRFKGDKNSSLNSGEIITHKNISPTVDLYIKYIELF
ncbi:MAG: hypothetical protein BWY26_00687 [Elusimicrobia bacterium ADurb.Bin231]|nr:MAG: hypothetical protein BWY26_00687 [Elusimicrobia bacterium ADurb.Bin231]